MFDPFGDYETAGYLRNIEGIKDLDELKRQEHVFFEANLEEALSYLHAIKGKLTYSNFLQVHRLLFGEFYPWAGQDRLMLGVGRLVSKGKRIQFEVSERCQHAIEWGLSKGNDAAILRRQPGTVMGIFAWGHPFLDGNGRTMLLVHSELCHRAGFSIDWGASQKNAYLKALTLEIENPQGKHLDNYLLPFCSKTRHKDLLQHLMSLSGLDGRNRTSLPDIVYKADDPEANAAYQDIKRARGESI
ncbi:Fic family protein [Serratia sp. JSRIV001]|uniref:Fic/DOC family protein n=1 Tax=Serratia TaxID=613 RepID=UPI000BA29518|nr:MULTISPECIES: Fic family protein [Serratia]MEB7883723.1 Fic family protein [Serratia fonticola]PAA95991.1 cell filamentation protein [Serratia fonticola]UAN45533.1 Fic family protein [Serratia sp. JSRIV001]UAN51011.1 Fic family protein [Serratia sp. JSRIV002]CAI1092847.1 Protein involved in cell division [Serratia fonticola]